MNCPKHGPTVVWHDEKEKWVCSMGGCNYAVAKGTPLKDVHLASLRADEPILGSSMNQPKKEKAKPAPAKKKAKTPLPAKRKKK